jgi:hypothetical protein
MKRTNDDLQQKLSQQLQLLILSCNNFDSGLEVESLNIATRLRVLLHDTDKSKSLLEQLGLKSGMSFLDSMVPLDPVPTGEYRNGQPIMRISGMPPGVAISMSSSGARYVAPLDSISLARGMIAFVDWWSEGTLSTGQGRCSRKKLILDLANKEGGAHVDARANSKLDSFKQTQFGMTVSVGNTQGFANSPVDAIVRQIAWEFIESLRQADIISSL